MYFLPVFHLSTKRLYFSKFITAELNSRQVMPTCDDFLLRCWWQGKLQDCSALFEVRKSNEGFCCTFNAIKLSESIDL